MLKIIAIIAVAAGLLGTGCGTPGAVGLDEQTLPPAPAGFHWEFFPAVEVAVPAPDGWFRATSRRGETLTASLSREGFAGGSRFKTGFTLEVAADVSRTRGAAPSGLAARLAAEIAKAPENAILASAEQTEHGSARTSFIRFRDSLDPKVGTTAHRYYVAMDTDDMLYTFTFASPSASWDEAFAKYGKPMMKQIMMAP